ncbi:MAG: HAD-IIIA family hydrolase [Bdellovibrionota bacterium]
MKQPKYIFLCSILFVFSCQHSLSTRAPSADEAKICPSQTRQKITNYQIPENGLIKVAFFDADSTVRVSLSGSVSANTPTDVRILPNVPKTLKMLSENNYLIYIVSNQGGVSAGNVTCETADGALNFTVQEITRLGGVVHGYDFAENSNEMRKPETGMAKKLEQILKTQFGEKTKIDMVNSFMVGDSAFKKEGKNNAADLRLDYKTLNIVKGTHFSNADRLFAQNYGIYFYEPTVFFGWRALGIDVLETSEQVDQYGQKFKALRRAFNVISN